MPAVAVDLTQLDANIHRFHQAAADHGCQVRAHLKAHRTIELARRQVVAGAAGVSVQTAHAARRLAAVGITDVVVAWPWPEPWRFPLLAEAAAIVPRFAAHVDRAAAVTGIGAAAIARGTTVGVRIDLRLTPPGAVMPIAELVAATPGVVLDGVTGYHALATPGEVGERHETGRRYAQQAVEVAEKIRGGGIDCPVVSIAGTLTAPAARSVPGVTEICAGAYATFDGGLATAGACTRQDVALSVARESSELLDGCTHAWAPEVTSLPAAGPDQGRLLPAHVCPLAVTLVRRQIGIAVVRDGAQVETWLPFAAPDRP